MENTFRVNVFPNPLKNGNLRIGIQNVNTATILLTVWQVVLHRKNKRNQRQFK
jgi:hypothetical protein